MAASTTKRPAAAVAAATAPKVHVTAACIVPPVALWAPVQAIRTTHDRHCARWPPHVNLLYPFVPETELPAAAERLAHALQAVWPFEVRLDRLGHFRHPSGSCTVYAAPDVPASTRDLQRAMQAAFPAYDDLAKVGSVAGFTPHMTLGQWAEDDVHDAVRALERVWPQVTFTVRGIYLIARDANDGTAPFRARYWIPFHGVGPRTASSAQSLEVADFT